MKNQPNFQVIAAGFYLCGDEEEMQGMLDILEETEEQYAPNGVLVHVPYENDSVGEILAAIDDLADKFKEVWQKGRESEKKPSTQLYQLYDKDDEVWMLVQGAPDMEEDIQAAHSEWNDDELEGIEGTPLEDYLEEKLGVTRVFVENVNL